MKGQLMAAAGILILAIVGAIVWWRLGVAEERERQKQAGSAGEQ